MHTKNVLFVGPNYKKRKGGIASVLRLYAENIKEFNFYPSAYFQNTKLNFLLLPFLCFGFLLKLFFLGKKIKIVHIHGASRGSFYRKYLFFLISKKVFKKKLIYHVHGAEYHVFYENASKKVKKHIQRMINNADLIIALSEEWSIFFKKNFSPKKLVVLNNIVAYRKEQEQNIPKKFLQLLFLGRIGERKGTFDLIDVIAEHKSYFEDKLRLVIGGDGAIYELKQKIGESNIQDIVTYIGWVDGRKKEELLATSNILVLPSYNEGLPISLLEGMSYSMPIIATNVGGIPQILKHNINGISVAPGDKKQLAEAIKFYIENTEKLVEHGKASYQQAKNFFPSKVINELEGIYRNLI
ncbi:MULTISPECIES: glycosyltransferase family 4 protein [Mesonia]|uniref:Alpha-D-kanosaminyltransferase n=1 Tax=Mesonia oceanica TaxID=2687242 RepID=A0AC61Y2S2_9FLAO|nr:MULTISPECIES: glycosyltransferase family 4 protein [Mesonia]VVU98776.1 Alpha-D-kanosaminyltransferase [Mesonia oceanica]